MPVRVEQLIYSLTAFNGSDYSSTFALQTADTIYLLAGTDNLLSVRKTLVYWWPITAEWKTDTDSLNQPFSREPRGARPQGTAFAPSPSRRRPISASRALPGPQWKVLTGA